MKSGLSELHANVAIAETRSRPSSDFKSLERLEDCGFESRLQKQRPRVNQDI